MIEQYEDCSGWTTASTLANLQLDLSSSLKIFIEDKSIKYNLALDYGMGAVPICSEKDGIIEWAYEKFK